MIQCYPHIFVLLKVEELLKQHDKYHGHYKSEFSAVLSKIIITHSNEYTEKRKRKTTFDVRFAGQRLIKVHFRHQTIGPSLQCVCIYL